MGRKGKKCQISQLIFLIFPHSTELDYPIDTLDIHYLRNASVDASSMTKFHLHTLQSGYTTVPAELKEAHEAKHEHVEVERTKPISPTYTSVLSSLKELLYSPTWRRAKAFCPAKNKLTLIDSPVFGKEELHCCFWTEHLVHKHSACKAEKHGKRIMGGCGAIGECFDQHMELQLLTRKDPPLDNCLQQYYIRFHNICAVITYF